MEVLNILTKDNDLKNEMNCLEDIKIIFSETACIFLCTQCKTSNAFLFSCLKWQSQGYRRIHPCLTSKNQLPPSKKTSATIGAWKCNFPAF